MNLGQHVLLQAWSHYHSPSFEYDAIGNNQLVSDAPVSSEPVWCLHGGVWPPLYDNLVKFIQFIGCGLLEFLVSGWTDSDEVSGVHRHFWQLRGDGCILGDRVTQGVSDWELGTSLDLAHSFHIIWLQA